MSYSFMGMPCNRFSQKSTQAANYHFHKAAIDIGFQWQIGARNVSDDGE